MREIWQLGWIVLRVQLGNFLDEISRWGRRGFLHLRFLRVSFSRGCIDEGLCEQGVRNTVLPLVEHHQDKRRITRKSRLGFVQEFLCRLRQDCVEFTTNRFESRLPRRV
jgi:hypothetical protein